MLFQFEYQIMIIVSLDRRWVNEALPSQLHIFTKVTI